MMKLPTVIKVTNSGKFDGIYNLSMSYIGQDNYRVVYYNKITNVPIIDVTVNTNDRDSALDIIKKAIDKFENISEYKLYESVEVILTRVEEEV